MPEYKAGDVCPRCGLKIDNVVVKVTHGRRYLYAVHRGNGRTKYCYLGPAEGYVYAKLAPSQTNVVLTEFSQAVAETLEGLLSRARELSRIKMSPAPLAELRRLLLEYVRNTEQMAHDLGYDIRSSRPKA